MRVSKFNSLWSLAGALTFILVLQSSAFAQTKSTSIADITSTIQLYFDGTQYGEPELVSKAFAETLFVQWIDADGNFRSRDASSYIERIEKGRQVARFGKIVSLDVTDNAASAKVEISYGQKLYTDYLLLLKIDGVWKITNKIATF